MEPPRGRVANPLPADADLVALDPVEVLAMTEAGFRTRFKPTPLFRPKWAGMRRNAAIVLGNVGGEMALPAPDDRAKATRTSVVREAAAWASEQIPNADRAVRDQPA